MTNAYDFSKPEPAARLLSLYPDSGRIISAVAGRVTTTRDTLAGEIAGFWQRVGRNMQHPRFVLGSTYVDVITRDAAVLTLVYSIPHTTPQGTPHTVSGAWTMLWRRDNGRAHCAGTSLRHTRLHRTGPRLGSPVRCAAALASALTETRPCAKGTVAGSRVNMRHGRGHSKPRRCVETIAGAHEGLRGDGERVAPWMMASGETLLSVLHDRIVAKHYSVRTEEAYP